MLAQTCTSEGIVISPGSGTALMLSRIITLWRLVSEGYSPKKKKSGSTNKQRMGKMFLDLLIYPFFT